ncbi:MAG: hypothetical protein ACRCTZ_07795 [Sarcina sp.]
MIKKNRVGERNVNAFGSKMEIIEYRNALDMDIYFPEFDYVSKNVTYNNFKINIKSPYCKTVCGVGYIGEGNHSMYVNGKATKCYSTWKGMLERCYRNDYKNRVYKNSYVCEEWLCYQNFADWYNYNYYEVPNQLMCLDKDILFKGNKEYSDYYCMFVPQDVNKLFTKSNAIRGDYPIGVSYEKKESRFKASCNRGNKKRTFLGYYDSPEDAFISYKNYKERVIKNMAEKYKEYIPREVYKAMYEYEVEITD